MVKEVMARYRPEFPRQHHHDTIHGTVIEDGQVPVQHIRQRNQAISTIQLLTTNPKFANPQLSEVQKKNPKSLEYPQKLHSQTRWHQGPSMAEPLNREFLKRLQMNRNRDIRARICKPPPEKNSEANHKKNNHRQHSNQWKRRLNTLLRLHHHLVLLIHQQQQ